MDDQTRCVTKESVDVDGFDSLSVPIHRASTIPFADAKAYASRFDRGPDGYTYGLYGTPTHRHLEQKLSALEGAERTLLVPSGQAAIALVMICLLKPGDTVLIPDSVYPPVRDFADQDLTGLDIQSAFYDPLDLDALAAAMNPSVKLIWVESPGSTSMEVQDLPGIVDIARRHNALVGCDNTWATPLLFKPLAHGADVCVEALSKYISGHSDLLMGSISLKDRTLGLNLKAALGRIGIGVSPDDCALALRGLETLPVRLSQSGDTALKLARWLADQPLVDHVRHPALPGCPGHDLWARDFAGAAGVFSAVLAPEAMPHVPAAFDALNIFRIGGSWGGTQSLLVPMTIKENRTAVPWTGPNLILRASVGLESADALQRDLSAFLDDLTNRTSQVAPATQTAAGGDSASAPRQL